MSFSAKIYEKKRLSFVHQFLEIWVLQVLVTTK